MKSNKPRRGWKAALGWGAAGVGVGALALLADGLFSGPHAAPEDPPHAIPSDLQFIDLGLGAQETLISNDVVASMAYSCLPTPTGIAIRTSERIPGTQQWESQEFFYSTSYSPTVAASREGGSEIYVAGIQSLPDGDWCDVIEKWAFSPIEGAYRGGMQDPATPRGVGRGPFSGAVHVVGGSYVPVAERVRQPSPQRTLLYRGKDYQHIEAMEVDPEGRFLLFKSFGLRALYSMDLMSSPPTIGLELDEQDLPHLELVHGLGVFDHPTAGRFYRLSETNMQGKFGATGSTTFLLDPDNDGFFDQAVTLTPQQKKTSAFADETAWNDLENYGWDFKSAWGED